MENSVAIDWCQDSDSIRSWSLVRRVVSDTAAGNSSSCSAAILTYSRSCWSYMHVLDHCSFAFALGTGTYALDSGASGPHKWL